MNDNERPQVIVSVEGGLANVTVIRGDVEIFQWDWDVIQEGEREDVDEAIAEAEGLPDDYEMKAVILDNMRDELLKFGTEEEPADPVAQMEHALEATEHIYNNELRAIAILDKIGVDR